jgi:ribosome maturation factor RimP
LRSEATKILTLAEPIAGEMGLEVLDIEFSGGASGRLVRIYLDNPAADRDVSVADCEALSRRMGDVLDAHEAVAGHYMLEVSSPGVNRPLRKASHFEAVVGGRVRVRMNEPVDDKRMVVGSLVEFDDGRLCVKEDSGEVLETTLDNVERANFEFEFKTPEKPGKRRKNKATK